LDEKPDSKPKDAKKKDAPAGKKDAKGKFKRVMIEESSDEEEEPKIEEVGGSETNSGESKWFKKGGKASKGIDSKFPLTSQKDIDAHSRMAKKMMQEGGDAFMKRMEEQERYFAKSTEDTLSAEQL
jgi:rubrerythrin